MKKNISGSRDLVRPPNKLFAVLLGVGLLGVLGGGYHYWEASPTAEPLKAFEPQVIRVGPDEIQLASEQTQELKVGSVEALPFEVRRDAIGIIDYNQDMAVQVFSPYQGRIGNLMVRAGDDVRVGQVLYTVQIPDLAAAASLLITSSGTLKVANQTLRRAQTLYETQSIALKELQQNTADQQAGPGAYPRRDNGPGPTI